MTLTLNVPDELSAELERAAKVRGINVERFVLDATEWALSSEDHDLFDVLAHKRTLKDVQGLPPLADE
jgi:hypothetical protein